MVKFTVDNVPYPITQEGISELVHDILPGEVVRAQGVDFWNASGLQRVLNITVTLTFKLTYASVVDEIGLFANVTNTIDTLRNASKLELRQEDNTLILSRDIHRLVSFQYQNISSDLKTALVSITFFASPVTYT